MPSKIFEIFFVSLNNEMAIYGHGLGNGHWQWSWKWQWSWQWSWKWQWSHSCFCAWSMQWELIKSIFMETFLCPFMGQPPPPPPADMDVC